jgi:succinate dehydrogenase / fumarate reductase flavoprotein subunit
MYHQFKVLAELDITTEPMEVGPTLHYCMGGVKVDADSQMSTVQGLFACGECSGGMHGANRLGGNSLSDLLVFGKLAGDGVFDYINALSMTPSIEEKKAVSIIRNATEILNREKGENPYLLHEDLQEAMQNNVGIVRSEELLREGLAQLDNLRRSVKNVKAEGASQFNPGWHEAIALRNLLITAEATAKAALTREESRGAHTRIDFPDERDDFLNVNVVTYKGEDGSMKAKKVNRTEPPAELNRIANLSIEELEQEIKMETI